MVQDRNIVYHTLGDGMLSVKLLVTAGGQKWVIMSVAQAVECYVAYFNANNYEYSNKLVPQISQYYVICFSRITMQRIYPGKDSYSCWIQVEYSSRQHSNTRVVRSPWVLTFKISFCTQHFVTFQNVFDNVDIQLLCRQEILEIPCPVFHWQVCKEWCTGALSFWKKHGLPQNV